MEYTHLGRSGLSVSRLCLGTMNFGWKTEEPDAHEVMDRALEEGVNFFDTADVSASTPARGGPRRSSAPGSPAVASAGRRPCWPVAWLLHQPAVTAPIVGPRTAEQFEGSLRALEVRLDKAQLARLDEIFPGYRAAPMEYAW